MLRKLSLCVVLALALSACQEAKLGGSNRHLAPIPPATVALMTSKGVSASDPILMRSYKKEAEVELWKKAADGKYVHLKTYPICRWSGQLGPKLREGDRQAPEGFYDVTPGAMNPNSSLYLSFNLGYPNEYDREHGRTGAHIMVHGQCSSRGCYAMTDEAMSEVYALTREAFASGQRSIQFQSFPFRMTPENLAKHRRDPHIAFWRNLKEGSDEFDVSGEAPRVSVAGGKYVFNGGQASAAAASKRAQDDRQVAELVAKGTPAIRLAYEDGGQHPVFRELLNGSSAAGEGSFAVLDARGSRSKLGEVSRPDALASGPREIVLNIEPSGRAKSSSASRAQAPVQAVPPRILPLPRPAALADARSRDGALRALR
ncbi:L,D-transpeptidase family protein [Enterovirga aerilata]|uniref:L,D-transpeptidase family protein n=1 Tax=Enterovirga aerilata TaxID=2730920 RepID=UPI001FEDD994|nr:murein L,D-transpeptidase family protein [Enterovirga sp. DB1703]